MPIDWDNAEGTDGLLTRLQLADYAGLEKASDLWAFTKSFFQPQLEPGAPAMVTTADVASTSAAAAGRLLNRR